LFPPPAPRPIHASTGPDITIRCVGHFEYEVEAEVMEELVADNRVKP
jgi:hypothetical protein